MRMCRHADVNCGCGRSDVLKMFIFFRSRMTGSFRLITSEFFCAGLYRITTTVRERRLRFSGHCWRRKNEVVSDFEFVGTEAWQ